MKTATFFLIFISIFNQINLSAQNVDSLEIKNRPFQITFFTPLGTNGLDAGKYCNDFSLNIFAGYNGGVKGIEIGGFANNLKYNMDGAQFAGFSNVVLGKTDGCQFAGFSNVSRKSAKGIQASGFSNVVCDNSTIVQAAGFSNVVKGETKGIQVSGFSNVCIRESEVIQAAGFSNVVRGNNKGIQVSGFSNVCTGNSKSLQAAGFINITSGTTEGVQISGFLNYSKKLKGIQLGVFNYCDTIEKGIPIGFLSIVRNGYRAVDISADESFYLNASIHTGVKQFYNIFSIGAKPAGKDFYWGFGYGVGSYLNLSKNIDLNLELSSIQINKNQYWSNSLNLLNKAKLNLLFHVNDHLGLYAGISYNVFVSDKTNLDGDYIDSGFTPWASYKEIYQNTLIKMYPGINVGIRIF